VEAPEDDANEDRAGGGGAVDVFRAVEEEGDLLRDIIREDRL
jgi:hypothetical protein